jgi:hypothetical protein
MRRNSTSSLGALHPVLFFMFVYGISLFLAIFVCRTVYFSINQDVADQTKNEIKTDVKYTATTASISVLK